MTKTEIAPAILREIEHQAKIKGQKIPEVKTLEEARTTLRRLLAI